MMHLCVIQWKQKTNATNVYLMYYRVFTIMLNTMNPFTCELFQVFPSAVF